jgi:hypothetical protein
MNSAWIFQFLWTACAKCTIKCMCNQVSVQSSECAIKCMCNQVSLQSPTCDSVLIVPVTLY